MLYNFIQRNDNAVIYTLLKFLSSSDLIRPSSVSLEYVLLQLQ